MRSSMIAVERLTRRLATACLYVSSAGLVLMTVIVFGQVFVRYLLGSSLHWAEPSAVLIMGWFIFLGAAVGIREGSHLSFDVALHFAPRWIKPVFHTISDLAIAGFGFGMLWYGWQLAAKAASNTIPGLGVSRALDFTPIIVGGLILMLFSAERILRRSCGLSTPRFGDHVEE